MRVNYDFSILPKKASKRAGCMSDYLPRLFGPWSWVLETTSLRLLSFSTKGFKGKN